MDWLSPIRELWGFVASFLVRVPIIRAILGFILVFFLPGFAWTLVFLRQINILERVVFSLALSVAIVTLSFILVNGLIGIKLTAFNSAVVLIIITIVPVIIYYLNRLMRRGRVK